jgi:hypothetical protein
MEAVGRAWVLGWKKISDSRPSVKTQGGGARDLSGPGSPLRLDHPQCVSVASPKSNPQHLPIRVRTGNRPQGMDSSSGG